MNFANNLLSPTKIFLVVFAQIVAAYLGFLQYWADRYGVQMSIGPMVLWILALFSFSFGAFVFRNVIRLEVNNGSERILQQLRCVSQWKLDLLTGLVLSFALASTFLIYSELGGLPLFEMIFYDINIADLVARQEDALPGLFGAHRIIITMLNICISLNIARSIAVGSPWKVRVFLLLVVDIVLSTMNGKREELAIMVTLFAYTAFSVEQIDKSSVVRPAAKVGAWGKWALLGLLAILAFAIMKGITYIRLDAVGSSDETSAELFRYISLPLINIEYIWQAIGLGGGEFNLLRPFGLLVPAKLMPDRDYTGFAVPEITSPLGFFATAWVFWGGWLGIFILSSLLGFFCQLFHFLARYSFPALLVYGFAVWHIVVSHTHNHFLTNVYWPAQIVLCYVFFRLVTVQQSK